MKKSKYLVRKNDFHIFEVDESNGCYRSYSTRQVTDSDGDRPQAYEHFTFENLTQNYDYFPIHEYELEIYERMHEERMEFICWQSRPDGHGGSKGGTYTEFLIYKKTLEEYLKQKDE